MKKNNAAKRLNHGVRFYLTITKLIELNEDFLTRFRILEALNNSYRSLPNAHTELMNAVEKPGYDLAAVKGLYENGKHMYDLYRELNEAK
jgi:hypothetical protein